MKTDHVRGGQLLFCSGRGLVSDLIEGLSGSKWSHVGLIVTLRDVDMPLVLESKEGHGVRLVPLSRYETYDGEVWTASVKGVTGLSGVAWSAMLAYGFRQLGLPYAWQDIVSLTDQALGGPRLVRQTPTAFICSSFVQAVLQAGGVALSPMPVPSPGDLASSDQLTGWTRLNGTP